MVLKQRWTRKMRLHMRKYVAYVRIYANFWICGTIFAYAILKMPLYAEKYAICRFWQKALQFFADIILTDKTFLSINLAAGRCRYTELTLTEQVNCTKRPFISHNSLKPTRANKKVTLQLICNGCHDKNKTENATFTLKLA